MCKMIKDWNLCARARVCVRVCVYVYIYRYIYYLSVYICLLVLLCNQFIVFVLLSHFHKLMPRQRWIQHRDAPPFEILLGFVFVNFDCLTCIYCNSRLQSYFRNTVLFLNLHTSVTLFGYSETLRYFRCKRSADISNIQWREITFRKNNLSPRYSFLAESDNYKFNVI